MACATANAFNPSFEEGIMKVNFTLRLGIVSLAFAALTLHAEDSEALLSKYFTLAASEKAEDLTEAKKVGQAYFDAEKTEADKLNEFSWKIMTEDAIKKRDLELAMKVAKAAFDLTEGKNAAIVDTYARAFFDSGKIEDGIKWQKKAIEVCTDDNLKSELQETLKKYEEKAATPEKKKE
jgi:tetratricopeptide (TPR) repeat protein